MTKSGIDKEFNKYRRGRQRAPFINNCIEPNYICAITNELDEETCLKFTCIELQKVIDEHTARWYKSVTGQ